MPFELPKALIDAGGWVVAACIAIGVIVAIIREDLVSGRAYKREVDRADKATAQLERNSETVEGIGRSLDTLLELLTKLLQLKMN